MGCEQGHTDKETDGFKTVGFNWARAQVLGNKPYGLKSGSSLDLLETGENCVQRCGTLLPSLQACCRSTAPRYKGFPCHALPSGQMFGDFACQFAAGQQSGVV